MTILQVLVGVFATAGLFAWFGAGFGRQAGSRAGGCGSCTGECTEASCSLQEREEMS
jgi:hypothetical protein